MLLGGDDSACIDWCRLDVPSFGVCWEVSDMNGKELSLYIHIPFCVKKCDYCDFLSAPANRFVMEHYVGALVKEIRRNKGLAYYVKTIFIGGGTPSLLDGEMMREIFDALYDSFSIKEDTEISIEINPGTIDGDKLRIYKEIGINRLSFGLQSAHNEELKLLGRIHSYEEFKENFLLAKNLGFTNINVDLMSGLPNQKIENWLFTLKEVTSLKPSHISAYSLIVEEETPFYKRYSSEDLDEELDRVIYKETKCFLESKGYFQYEISNYAKAGYDCKHNSVYWKRGEYLGLGLGSASLIGNERFCNEKDLNTYIKAIEHGYDITRERTLLSIEEQMEEFMFLGLRMTTGISLKEFEVIFDIAMEEIYQDVICKTIEEGLLMIEDNHLRLTEKGIDLSNMVMSRFLFG